MSDKDLWCATCRKMMRHERAPLHDTPERDAYVCHECHTTYLRLTDAAIYARAVVSHIDLSDPEGTA